jgi:hypothetical protein
MSRGAWSSSACFHRVDLRILPNSKRAATALRLACICDQNTTLPLRNYISLRGVHVNRSCQVWSVNGMRMRLLLTCYISKRLLYDNMRKAGGARWGSKYMRCIDRVASRYYESDLRTEICFSGASGCRDWR